MNAFRRHRNVFVRALRVGVLLHATALLAEDHAFFESKVRPVLVGHCYECHSGVNSKGGLLLDTRQGWAKGGKSGPAIVPGKPDESLLIKAIRHTDPDLAMPPKKKGGKLPAADIAALTEWVRQGAPDPRIAAAKIAGMKADEAKSGTEIWSERIGGNYSASPLHANGNIYFFSEEGKTTVIKAGRKMEKVAESTLPDGFMASPAVTGKSFIPRTRSTLHKIEE